MRARDDVCLACHDMVWRGRHNIADDVVDALAEAAFVAALNALDIAVPERLNRKATFTTPAGQRVTIPRKAPARAAEAA